jgi:hypothetical protein
MLSVFEVFEVSKDTWSNLGCSRTKPLFPDAITQFPQRIHFQDLFSISTLQLSYIEMEEIRSYVSSLFFLIVLEESFV